jgi:hypothetical protein
MMERCETGKTGVGKIEDFEEKHKRSVAKYKAAEVMK